jgi:hypothetical protein
MWRDEWLAHVAGPCMAAHPVASLVVAANPNVSPWSPCVREMWRTPACRELLVRSWERRGLDVLLARGSYRVLCRACLRDDDGWLVVEPEYVELEAEPDDVRYAVLAHVSVDVRSLVGQQINVAALSRNERLRPADLAHDVAFDARALATNKGLDPATLMRLGVETSDFYAALSTHPALTPAHVRARVGAPWCWYTLSARCLTPADADLPLFPGALVLNPSFSEADLAAWSLERPAACAKHAYACGPRGAACGLRLAPVNWPVYLRLTDDPTAAVQEALDTRDEALIAESCAAVLGNPNVPLGLAAWCLARLGPGVSRWTCLSAVANEMAADREAHRACARAVRAQYAEIVRVCLRRGAPVSVCRAVHALLAPAPVSRVVRATGDERVVRFRCGLTPDSLRLPAGTWRTAACAS